MDALVTNHAEELAAPRAAPLTNDNALMHDYLLWPTDRAAADDVLYMAGAHKGQFFNIGIMCTSGDSNPRVEGITKVTPRRCNPRIENPAMVTAAVVTRCRFRHSRSQCACPNGMSRL